MPSERRQGGLESPCADGDIAEMNDDRQPHFLHQSHVAGAHRALDAGGDRCGLPHRDPGVRVDDEVRRIPCPQPDGQGSGNPPRGQRGHGSRRHLRLPRRRLPGGRARASARRARRLLPVALLRGRAARSGDHQPVPGLRAARRPAADGRLRQLRVGDGYPRARRVRRRLDRGRALLRRRRLRGIARRLGARDGHHREAARLCRLLVAGRESGGPAAGRGDRQRPQGSAAE